MNTWISVRGSEGSATYFGQGGTKRVEGGKNIEKRGKKVFYDTGQGFSLSTGLADGDGAPMTVGARRMRPCLVAEGHQWRDGC